MLHIFLQLIFIASFLSALGFPQSYAMAITPPPDLDLLSADIGVNVHFTEPQNAELDALAAAGFRCVRIDFSWANTEREQGHYDFASYDHLLNTLDAAHLRIVFILDYSNHYYDDDLSPHSIEGRAAFVRWSKAAISHFKGHHIIWEMYNEPNMKFWRPKVNVEAYTALALAVGQMIAETAPREFYMGPACAGMDLTFLEACFKAGCLKYWAAVSVHPYRQTDPETAAEDYRHLRKMIAAYLPKGKRIPIVVTEWGYSSTWSGYNESKQAQMLARASLINIANDIALSLWYDWRDDGPDGKDPEHHFGTVRYDVGSHGDRPNNPKPAYLAARTMGRFLKGFQYNKRLDLGNDSDYVLLFCNDKAIRLAAWTTGLNHKAIVPASPGTFRATTYVGTDLPSLIATTGGLRLELNDTPQYIEPAEPNSLLLLAAAAERVPLDMYLSSGDQQMQLLLANVSGATVRFRGQRETGSVEIAPGARATLHFRTNVPRLAEAIPWRVEWEIEGIGKLAQTTIVNVNDAMQVLPIPLGKRGWALRIENPSGKAFSGFVIPTLSGARGSVSSKITLGPGMKEATIKLISRAAHIQVQLKEDTGGAIGSFGVSSPWDDFARYRAGEAPSGYQLDADGDANVGSEQSLVSGGVVIGNHTPSDAPALKLKYRFDAGWKYVRVSPTTKLFKTIDGRPKGIGFWICGDGQGNTVAVRFGDSAGQLFQVNAAPLDWTGWRYVRFPLDGTNAAHWGPVSDGVVHYPIQLNTLLLLDSPRKQPTQGEISFTMPVLMYGG